MEDKIAFKRLIKFLKISLEVIIFIAAMFFIHKELQKYNMNDLKMSLENIPLWAILLIIIFVILDYLILTGFDILAFKYQNYKFPIKETMFTSFISFAFSNSVGLSGLTASGIRINLYSAWGIPYKTIINVVIFCYITYWLGLLWIGGVFLSFSPVNLANLHLPFKMPIENSFYIGVLLLLIAVTFTAIRFIKYNATLKLYFTRILLALGDWICIAFILYFALPDENKINFFHFLPIFILAQTFGVISNVPGGIGVFDLIILTLLNNTYSSDKIIGALLIYRISYFFIPLLIAFIAFTLYHIFHKKILVKSISLEAEKYIFSMYPVALSLFIFLSGATLIFSGAIPPKIQEMNIIQEFFPIATIQISHFLGSIVGAILVILAYGIKRRLDVTYYLTIGFLILGIFASLIKDLDIKSAIGLLVVLICTVPSKKYFYRKSSIFKERLSITWILLVLITILLGMYIGFFSHKQKLYFDEIFWKFSAYDDAPKFLRAILGVFIVLAIFIIIRLIKAAPVQEIDKPEDLDKKMRKCIENSNDTNGYFALLGDKQLIFEPDGESFIMFGRSGRSLISMGDPVGKEDSFGDCIWTFYNYCKEQHMETVFYEIKKEFLDYYLDIGLSFLKIGECARVDLSTFTLEGGKASKLRYSYNKFTKDGFTFEIVEKEKVPSVISELKEISDEWLKAKSTKEKGFSLGKFSEDYLSNFPVGVIKKDNKIYAFSNLLETENKEEITLDLMRYRNEAPNGTMDFCFICLLLYGKSQGFKKFNLGMAPLSGIESNSASIWNKIENVIFTHGEHFYNFKGLRAFKEKFNPEWEPRYIAYSGPFNLPRVLKDITLLISGGIKGLVSKK